MDLTVRKKNAETNNDDNSKRNDDKKTKKRSGRFTALKHHSNSSYFPPPVGLSTELVTSLTALKVQIKTEELEKINNDDIKFLRDLLVTVGRSSIPPEEIPSPTNATSNFPAAPSGTIMEKPSDADEINPLKPNSPGASKRITKVVRPFLNSALTNGIQYRPRMFPMYTPKPPRPKQPSVCTNNNYPESTVDYSPIFVQRYKLHPAGSRKCLMNSSKEDKIKAAIYYREESGGLDLSVPYKMLPSTSVSELNINSNHMFGTVPMPDQFVPEGVPSVFPTVEDNEAYPPLINSRSATPMLKGTYPPSMTTPVADLRLTSSKLSPSLPIISNTPPITHRQFYPEQTFNTYNKLTKNRGFNTHPSWLEGVSAANYTNQSHPIKSNLLRAALGGERTTSSAAGFSEPISHGTTFSQSSFLSGTDVSNYMYDPVKFYSDLNFKWWQSQCKEGLPVNNDSTMSRYPFQCYSNDNAYLSASVEDLSRGKNFNPFTMGPPDTKEVSLISDKTNFRKPAGPVTCLQKTARKSRKKTENAKATWNFPYPPNGSYLPYHKPGSLSVFPYCVGKDYYKNNFTPYFSQPSLQANVGDPSVSSKSLSTSSDFRTNSLNKKPSRVITHPTAENYSEAVKPFIAQPVPQANVIVDSPGFPYWTAGPLNVETSLRGNEVRYPVPEYAMPQQAPVNYKMPFPERK